MKFRAEFNANQDTWLVYIALESNDYLGAVSASEVNEVSAYLDAAYPADQIAITILAYERMLDA